MAQHNVYDVESNRGPVTSTVITQRDVYDVETNRDPVTSLGKSQHNVYDVETNRDPVMSLVKLQHNVYDVETNREPVTSLGKSQHNVLDVETNREPVTSLGKSQHNVLNVETNCEPETSLGKSQQNFDDVETNREPETSLGKSQQNFNDVETNREPETSLGKSQQNFNDVETICKPVTFPAMTEKDVLDVEIIFQPITSLGRYMALFSWDVKKNTSVGRIIGTVYFIIVQMIFWSMIIKDVLVILRERDSGRILPVVALVTHEIGIAYMSLITRCTFPKNYARFVRSLKHHQRSYEPIKNGRRLALIMEHLKGAGALFCLGSTVFYSLLLYLGRVDLKRVLYPFNFDGIKNSLIACACLLTHGLFIMSHSFILVVLTIVVFLMILLLFHSVNKNIDMLIDRHMRKTVNDSDFAEAVEKMRQEHKSVVNILEHANSLVAHLLFGVITGCVPIICFVLYGLIRNIVAVYEIYLMSSMVIISLVSNSAFLILASVINIKAHEPLEILLKADVNCLSDRAYKSITLFVSRLNGKAIGFRFYEMFTLDTSAILMIIGTLVTYAVVMLQFTSVPLQPNTISNQTLSNCTC